MKCPFPEVREVRPKAARGSALRSTVYRYPVPCGRCAECLLAVRFSKAGQGAMEGMHTREKLGLGHIWMASPSYDEDHCPWTDPRPIELGNELVPILRASRPAVNELAVKLFARDCPKAWQTEGRFRNEAEEQEFFALAQEHMLRHRWKFVASDVKALLEGDYKAKRTLHFRDVQRWFKRLRRRGLVFRYFVAAEYGDRNTRRPHYHVLFFGLDREEFIEALLDWQHGTTDPNPHTRKGLQRIDDQVHQNATARAAAAYLVKYLGKGKRAPAGVSDLVREIERTRSSSKPGLGYAWAMRALLPILNGTWHGALPSNLRHLDLATPVVDHTTGEMLWHHQGEFFRALGIDTRSRYADVGGQTFPVSTYLRDKLQSACDCPDELLELHRWLTSKEAHDDHELRMMDPTINADYKAEMAELREKHEQRETAREERERKKRERWAPRSEAVSRGATRVVPV